MESFHLGHDPEHLSIITLPHPADASNYDEIDNLGITFEDMQHTIAQNLKSIVSLSINEERLKYCLLYTSIFTELLYNMAIFKKIPDKIKPIHIRSIMCNETQLEKNKLS